MSIYRDNPCKPGCENRTAGCHSVCQDYMDWRAMVARKKEDKESFKKKDRMMEAVEITRGDRFRRRKPKER